MNKQGRRHWEILSLAFPLSPKKTPSAGRPNGPTPGRGECDYQYALATIMSMEDDLAY